MPVPPGMTWVLTLLPAVAKPGLEETGEWPMAMPPPSAPPNFGGDEGGGVGGWDGISLSTTVGVASGVPAGSPVTAPQFLMIKNVPTSSIAAASTFFAVKKSLGRLMFPSP